MRESQPLGKLRGRHVAWVQCVRSLWVLAQHSNNNNNQQQQQQSSTQHTHTHIKQQNNPFYKSAIRNLAKKLGTAVPTYSPNYWQGLSLKRPKEIAVTCTLSCHPVWSCCVLGNDTAVGPLSLYILPSPCSLLNSWGITKEPNHMTCHCAVLQLCFLEFVCFVI